MFTGRNLDGPIVGTGYFGLLCWDHFGSGLTQATRGATEDSLIAAHEIGHNFGAPHDAESGSPCESTPSTFLMAPSLNSSDQFSACSLEQMQPFIDGADCIVPVLNADVSIAPVAASLTVLLGDPASVTFEVQNAGTDIANNVMVDIGLPGIVTFASAVASAGTCTDGAGNVSCQPGSIASGATVSITISTTAAAVGSGTFEASVTADVDDDPGNNQGSMQIDVNPAVDLVANVPSALTLTVGESGTVSVRLENASAIDATGVDLAVSLGAGVRIDTANWPTGTCNITGQQVDCQANSFPARSSATLLLGLTAVAAGRQDYSLTMTALEADRDPSNNNINGAVTVRADTPPSGSGGGGAAGLFLFFTLLWASYRRGFGASRDCRSKRPQQCFRLVTAVKAVVGRQDLVQ
jgi:hypothetical protein